MRPADLGARLIAHGFVYDGSDIGMAADLVAQREEVASPPGLVVERVRDDRALADSD